ncbi:ATP-dependent DNA ligase [Lipomyces japonicus]|uniref:ATP-dependent DNA ligase n=1 Tax=Lipomyces japonicus TaxID=56871 RepID=UPI0034CD69C9
MSAPNTQQTLTRFFNRPPGSKPIKRQATLASAAKRAASKDAKADSQNKEDVSVFESDVALNDRICLPDNKDSSLVTSAPDSTQSDKKRKREETVKNENSYSKEMAISIAGSANNTSDTSDSIILNNNNNNNNDDALSEEELVEELPLTKKLLNQGPLWSKGTPVPYSAICATFEKIEATTKRLEIISYCSAFFQQVLALTPNSLLQVIYLFINKLCPDYEGLEIGLGESILMKAIGECTGRSLAQIKNDYQRVGDLGTIARDSRTKQPTMFKPKPLTAEEVYKNLKEIALITGTQSQSKKIGIINKLLSACKESEAKYLVRSLEGKLRIHLAEKTVLTSLAQAVVSWEARKKGKDAKAQDIIKGEEILKAVYSEMPTYELILPSIINYGIFNLRDHCTLTPGVPLKPMLAKPTKSISEVLDRFQDQKFTCEYKYDGERAQIHYVKNKKSCVYSRNSEDMSEKYPDVVSSILRFVQPTTVSFVIDCEAVAWDKDTNRILPFQVLSTRKRKDVQESDIKVRVCIFAFDILYLNGVSLLQKSLYERREMLREAFLRVENEFAFAQYMDSNDIDDIQGFLDQSVKDGCEGLMIKMLSGEESGYEPSKRSRNWLKLKKDYLTGVGDSLDLVVVGAYYGRGKRTNVYGAFLLACYNPDNQEYETICKIGTGFSEDMLEKLYQDLSAKATDQPRSYYSYTRSNSNAPDVWFEPTMVWEVLAADLSLSPIYRAAIAEMGRGKGISLRFPRFIRIRDDKGPEQATTSEQVSEFYNAQALAGDGNNEAGIDDYEY